MSISDSWSWTKWRPSRRTSQPESPLLKFNSERDIPLPDLDAENPDDPVRLSIKDLTILVAGEGRDNYPWEIGSGANWLSYHVAVTLALHQLFLGMQQSPVPSLLVLDQPSQVYFPRKAGVSSEEEFDPDFTDEDIEAVRKVFAVLAKVAATSKGRFQGIVLDHASEEVWHGIDHINLVEEWRGGRKLVPLEWLRD